MAITYGFYNSLNGDRKYNVTDMSAIFDGIINDGVFMSVGDKLMVTERAGMTVNVGTGRAWFNHTWTYNNSILPLELSPAEILMNRIDAIILEVNHEDGVRMNDIKILEGQPATNAQRPKLINNNLVHQYALGYIYVGKNTSKVTQANITNVVGSSDTPFVTGILETMDISALIAQWGTEWDEWNTARRDSFLVWIAEQELDFTNWSDGQKLAFDDWFEDIKGQLSTDAAGNLQNQMNEVKQHVSDSKNKLASVITDKGIYTDGDDTFEEITDNVRKIRRRNIGSLGHVNTYELVTRFGFDPVIALDFNRKVW